MPPSNRSGARTGPGDCRARFVLVLVIAALVGGCGAPRERFEGALGSPETLAEAFLQALEARDRPGMESLALSAREFRLEVFPEMPAYGNIPPDLAWSQLAARSLDGLSRVLETQGGRSWHLEGIVFGGGRTVYQTFVVYRKPMLRVRDRHTGERREMALFGSLLEHDGRYKLFSFNIDR
jgi:hypothetical protein